MLAMMEEGEGDWDDVSEASIVRRLRLLEIGGNVCVFF